MAKGFRAAGGVDFDDLFDPDVVGDGPSTSWMTSGGTPLRYAARSYGAKRADVGYYANNGQDVSNLWAAKGTAVYTIGGLHGSYYDVGDQALTSQSSVSASVSWALHSSGAWTVSGGTSRGAVAGSPWSGGWLPAGDSPSNWEVQFVLSQAGQGNAANEAPSYQNLGSTRGGSFTLPTAGGTSNERDGTLSVTVNLRRVGNATPSVTQFTIHLFTVGYS